MDRSKLVLLLVDDNFTMLTLMMPMLQSLGYRNFITASSGREAWNKLNGDQEIHLVVSDLIMPGLNGIELLTMIRESEKFWDLPFVMITGDENKDQLMSSIEIDINSYIIKPFTPEKLEKEINAVLREKYYPTPYHQAVNKGLEALFQQNEPEAAWLHFIEAGELQPLEADPFYFRAIILDRQGRVEEAKASLRKCISLRQAHTKAHDLLALIYHREGDYGEEVRVLNTITELSPNNMERNITLGKAYALLNDRQAVKEVLVKAAKLAKTQGKIHDKDFMTKIFEAYLQTDGMAGDAEEIYRKYIDKRMDQPRLLNRFAMILKEHKSYDMAVSFLERIVNIWRTVKNHGIPPEDMAVYYLNLAVAHAERANQQADAGEDWRPGYETARDVVDKALDCNPRLTDAMKLMDWLDKRLSAV